MRFFKILIFSFYSSIFFAQPFNDFVVKEACKYQGGTYKWAGSGCPVDIVYGEKVLLPKSSIGSHCSGFTFTVLFNTLKEHNLHDKLDFEQWKNFQQHWYGNTSIAAETQCLYALTTCNLGKKIELEEAQSGDFVQFWRNNNTGHSVVFLSWERDEKGKIVAMKYRSSQKVTNGIGDRVEPIGSGEKDINKKRIYVVRIECSLR